MKTVNLFKRLCGAAIITAMAMPLFTSCYDDSALNAKIDEVTEEVNKIKSDLAALQAAVDKELSVVEYNQIEGGYELIMSDGSKINIYNGAKGDKGDTGATGAQGEKGDKGDTGAQGPQGEKGDKGDTGAQGPQGEKGDKGDTGAQGPQGEKGDKGDTGATGAQGEKGDKGDKGDTGAQGPQGEKGDAFFESVELSEDGLYLVITLVDGTVYELPMGGFNLIFVISDEQVEAGKAVKVAYEIAGAAETDEVVVRILNHSNCIAEVLPKEGVVEITPDLGAGYVDLYAINNTTGELKAKTISFDGYTFTTSATTFYASPLGGDVEIPVTTSVDYELKIDGSWLAYVKTKDVRSETIVLTAAEKNTSDADLEATVELVSGKKVLATLKVVQKNYYPELIEVEGEQVEWAESFDLFKNEAATGTPDATKKGVFTFALSDDFSKGVYKISNMFMAASYYDNNNQPVSNKGGEYYADIEGGVLTVYRADAVKSYGFTDDVEVVYDATTNTFSIAEPVEAYVYGDGFNRTGYLANYTAVVKVDAPAGEGGFDKLIGEYTEEFADGSYYGNPAKGTLTIAASDNVDYDLQMTFFGGTSVAVTVYANVSEDGTTITTVKPSGYTNMGSFYESTLTVAGNVISGTLKFDYPTLNDYTATKQGGEEPELAEFAEKVWDAAVPFGNGQDRNMTMDAEYVYVAQAAGGNGVIKAISIADPTQVKDVKVTTYTPAGLDNGTHAISCVRMLPNTDASVNGGKDVLVASNLTTGDSTEKLIVYVWSNGIDADPNYFVIDSGTRRLGDKFTVKGTYQAGELFFFDFNDGNTVIRVNMKNGVAGLWGAPELAYATGRYTMPVAGVSNIGELTVHPDATYDADGNPSAALLTTNAVNGFFTQNTGNAYVASAWGTDPKLTQTFGYNFFEHNGKDYIAYVKVAGDRASAALNIIEDVNGAADLKGTLEAQTGLFTAPVNGTGNAGHGLGDCATAVIDGVRYIAVMSQNIGITLYKLN